MQYPVPTVYLRKARCRQPRECPSHLLNTIHPEPSSASAPHSIYVCARNSEHTYMGKMSWVFRAFEHISRRCFDITGAYSQEESLNKFIEELKKYGVITIVRVCEATYNTTLVEKEGICVLDWPLMLVHHHPTRF